MSFKNILFVIFWLLMTFILFKKVPQLLKKDNFRIIEGVILDSPSMRKCGRRDRNTCWTFQIEGFHFKEIVFTTNKLKIKNNEIPFKKGAPASFHILKNELSIRKPVTIYSLTVNNETILDFEHRKEGFTSLLLGLVCVLVCFVFISNPE